MKRNEYFDNHSVYNALSWQAVVGLIQLLIDEGGSPDEKNGLYQEMRDFREKVTNIYSKLDATQKQEHIAYFVTSTIYTTSSHLSD